MVPTKSGRATLKFDPRQPRSIRYGIPFAASFLPSSLPLESLSTSSSSSLALSVAARDDYLEESCGFEVHRPSYITTANWGMKDGSAPNSPGGPRARGSHSQMNGIRFNLTARQFASVIDSLLCDVNIVNSNVNNAGGGE